MIIDGKSLRIGRREAVSRLVVRLPRDYLGVKIHEYIVAAVALAFAAIVIFASQSIVSVLVSLLDSVGIVDTLATP